MPTRGEDIEFDAAFRRYFGATRGAYSRVTETEAGDGQVTLTGIEKEIALAHFGAASLAPYRGNDDVLAEKGLDARREFHHFPTGTIVTPKLKYAKAQGGELRLYFNDGAFKVYAGDNWGLFLRDGKIWICSFSSKIATQVASGNLSDGSRAATLEPDDDNFQDLANDAPPGQVTATTTKWGRNPSLAAQAFAAKDYRCELMPDGPSFVSRRSGKRFNEAHHLIPMREQGQYSLSLDTLDNICVLNPFAHRRLHHASFDVIVPDLRRLIASRPLLLERHGLLEDDLIGLYR
jgi:5-methylcytosine-specific restriction enzyme A